MTTTEVENTATVKAHDLLRLLDQTHAHQYAEDTVPAIHGVHFDSNGHTLHAVATDRYTMAVSRARLAAPGETWAHTVPYGAVKALRKWAAASQPEGRITVTPRQDGDHTTVTFSDDVSTLSFRAAKQPFPAWRSLVAGAVNHEPTADIVGLDSSFAARWKSAERGLRNWTTGPTSPVVYAGADFIGMQMPIRPGDGSHWDHAATAKAWQSSIGDTEATDAATVLDGNDTGTQRDKFIERLLWRVVITSDELSNTVDINSPRWSDVVHTHIYAWSTFRLLQALASVSPAFAETVLADLDDELDGGDFAEWAWEYAKQAGHDPEKWADEYHAAVAARAAEDAKAAAPASE